MLRNFALEGSRESVYCLPVAAEKDNTRTADLVILVHGPEPRPGDVVAAQPKV